MELEVDTRCLHIASDELRHSGKAISNISDELSGIIGNLRGLPQTEETRWLLRRQEQKIMQLGQTVTQEARGLEEIASRYESVESRLEPGRIVPQEQRGRPRGGAPFPTGFHGFTPNIQLLLKIWQTRPFLVLRILPPLRFKVRELQLINRRFK